MRSGLGGCGAGPRTGPEPRRADLDPYQGLRLLARDPALGSTEAGRLPLRVLSTLPLIDQDPPSLVGADRPSLVGAVPAHDLPVFQRMAAANAETCRVPAELAAEREGLARTAGGAALSRAG